MQRYSKEIKQFIIANVLGRTSEELAFMVNEKFGLSMTANKIKSFKTNHGLKSGTPKGKKAGFSVIFTEEMQAFISEHLEGRSTQDLTDLINEMYGTDFSVSQLRSYKKNHKLPSGIDAKFKPGNTPPNKGLKGIRYSGCEKTWFKRGLTPHNHKPMGSERIDSKDGYTLVKVAEPDVWELKHKVLYESIHGKVPEGYVVTFLDSDKTNISIDNLQAISMAESCALTCRKLRFSDADLTRTGLLIVKIKHAKKSKLREKPKV